MLALPTSADSALQVVQLDTSAQTLAIAQANSAKINAALLGRGHVMLTGIGNAAVTGTHTVYSDTTLHIASGLVLANYTHLVGGNTPMFVNANWQSSGGGILATGGAIDFYNLFTVTVSGVTVTPTIGAAYTNNGATFSVVRASITAGAGTILLGLQGVVNTGPTASGTLTKSSGTGDAAIAFSASVAIITNFFGTRLGVVDMGSNAHGLVVGDWALIKWDTSKSLLGIFQVQHVLDANKFVVYIRSKVAMPTSAGLYTFTVSGIATTPGEGAKYTAGGQTYAVVKTLLSAGAGTILCAGTGTPTGTGTLTKINATTGDASIAFTAGAQSVQLTVQKADANITICGGGTIDYRGYANQTVGDWNTMQFIFNKVSNLRMDGVTLLNCSKYGVYWGNCHRARFTNMTILNASAAIQGIALGIDIVHDNIMGATADDFIAYSANNGPIYALYDVPNGDQVVGPPLIGFTVRDAHITSTTNNSIGMYLDWAEWSGILIDGVECLTIPGSYFHMDDLGSGTAVLGGNDVKVRNMRGPGSKLSASPIKIGGVASSISLNLLDIEGFDFGASIVSPNVITVSNVNIGKMRIAPNCSMSADSTAGPKYAIQLIGTNSITDLDISGFRLTNSAGGNGTYLLAGNATSTIKNLYIHGNSLYGTTSAVTGGYVLSGAATIEGNYADAFGLLRTNQAGTYVFRNNTFNNLGGTPAVLLYGSGVTMNLHATGNRWGTTNNWLQAGVSAGDTLTLNVWNVGNGSAASFGTGITWTSTAGTFALRASDASLPMDAAKWGSIDTGCVYQNTNAAYGVGAGVYAKGPTAASRIAS